MDDDMRKKPDEYWKKNLTPEQYRILREKGTELAFTGKYYKNFKTGMYECGACGQPLFSSDAKFDSDCGWPSFDNVVNSSAVELKDDDSFLMHRTEVICRRCGGHLGHLFSDGPTKTRNRYCINSAALNFKEREEKNNSDLIKR